MKAVIANTRAKRTRPRALIFGDILKTRDNINYHDNKKSVFAVSIYTTRIFSKKDSLR
jgi:hypothetical protein